MYKLPNQEAGYNFGYFKGNEHVMDTYHILLEIDEQ